MLQDGCIDSARGLCEWKNEEGTSAGSFPRINIHEVLCTDHLWLNVGQHWEEYTRAQFTAGGYL